jgi:hypothetical protein
MKNETLSGNAPVYHPYMKFSKTSVQWSWWECGVSPRHSSYLYYFYWWNRLPSEVRYIGYSAMYYDGIHESFGFWFFNWTWTTPWTRDFSEEGYWTGLMQPSWLRKTLQFFLRSWSDRD